MSICEAIFSQFKATACLTDVEHAQLCFSYVLAPFYNFDSLISDKVKADLEQITMDIMADRIKTRP